MKFYSTPVLNVKNPKLFGLIFYTKTAYPKATVSKIKSKLWPVIKKSKAYIIISCRNKLFSKFKKSQMIIKLPIKWIVLITVITYT